MVKLKDSIILKHHKSQNYFVYFNQKTGLFLRAEQKGSTAPFWAESGPELLDISITNKCDNKCRICYRNISSNGYHMPLVDYINILEEAQKMGVLQIALGGGNPNQHPDFIRILEATRRFNIVPSYTTNGEGLTQDILLSTQKYCGAVAVTIYPFHKSSIRAIKLLEKYNVKTNLHFVLTKESIVKAIAWLRSPPDFLNRINAIIFLNYKAVGRFKKERLLLSHSNKLKEFFKLVNSKKYNFKIGFDSCCISGIVKFTRANKKLIEACEAGRFSAFISEDMKIYPCSFLENQIEGINLRKNKFKDTWRHGISFTSIRSRIKENECKYCDSVDICLGGCPIFKNINLCNNLNSARESYVKK